MKKIVPIIVLLICCVLFFNVGKGVVEKFQEQAINDAIDNDKYTAEEYADFQEHLKTKTFHYYYSLTDRQKDAYTTLYFAVKNFDESCKVRVAEDELKTILYSIIYDNSDIFWLSGNYTYYSYEDYIELVPEYKYNQNESEKISQTLENKINEIVSGISPFANDYEKELYLHDYICDNTVYDDSTFQNGGDTAYSALIDGKSVCEGYSRAMQILLDTVGITNYLVIGDGTSDGVTEPHMWNVVEIDGCNYHLDVTWDDSCLENYNCYFYFNVTDSYISRDHSNIEPKENNCIYNFSNYYVMNDAYIEVFTDFNGLVNSTANILSKGNNTVEFLFKNSNECKKAVKQLDNNAIFFDYVDNSVQKSGRRLSTTNVEYILLEDYNYLRIVFKED